MSAFWQEGFPVEPVLCVGWVSGCHQHLSPALSWRQTLCSSVQGSFRKCQSYWGEVGIEQGHGERNLSSRAARDLHLGTKHQSPCKLELQQSLSHHGCCPMYYTMRKANHVLNYRAVIQPWASDGYRNHLSSAALVWQPYAPGGNCNPAVCLSCLDSFFLPPYVLNTEVEVSTSIKTHKNMNTILVGM